METLQAHVGPIFLTYPKNVSVDKIMAEAMQQTDPVYNILTKDGIQHTVWLISDSEKIADLQTIFKNEIPYTYIANRPSPHRLGCPRG